MNAAIPPVPHATVDTRLDAPQALMLAEEAIGHQVPLMSNFGFTKVYGEVNGRHPTGFTYRTTTGPSFKIRLNDGYVVGQDNGQGGTRVSFYESKRSTMVYGILLGSIVALAILNYFLLVHQSATVAVPQYGGMGYPAAPVATGSGFPAWLYWILTIAAIAAIGMTAFQMYEIINAPKKAVQYFTMRANGGMPAPQPAFPGQAGAGMGQPAFPPQQPGFPPQQGGFPPQQAQPAGFPPQAQPQPQQGGFPHAPHPDFAGAAPAAAPAQHAPQPEAAPAPAPTDPAEKLRQLAELRDAGIITAADYDQAAAAIQAKG